MNADIQQLTGSYSDWLKDSITLRQRGQTAEITLPFMDRHNDCIQVYVRCAEDRLLLSDHGYTIADLEMCGCDMQTRRHKALLKATLNGFGVHLRDGELQVAATGGDFALRINNLAQAMLAVNDLYCLASLTDASPFTQQVGAWLDKSSIRYERNVRFEGKSGLCHEFDFRISASDNLPMRLLLAVKSPDRASAERAVFALHDTQETRPHDSQGVALLDDRQGKPHKDIFSMLGAYGILAFAWDDRDEALVALAA